MSSMGAFFHPVSPILEMQHGRIITAEGPHKGFECNVKCPNDVAFSGTGLVLHVRTSTGVRTLEKGEQLLETED